MKKIYILVIFMCLLFVHNNVKAEDFYEGSYFNTYVNKVKNNVTYYMTMQTIRDRDNNNKVIYCLEPFKTFASNVSFNKISNFSDYSLSNGQMERIEKLAYYGFGYAPKNRNTYDWYAVTQVLIWKVIEPNADIYFTDSLNGLRNDNKYLNEISELLQDVNNNGYWLNLNNNYDVVYGRGLSISLNKYYEIVDSNMNYTYENNVLKINDIKEDGYVSIREKANKEYTGEGIIYDTENNQDLYLPGLIRNKVFKINVHVIKGDITLDIRKDKTTYSVDASFDNTCYGIYKEDSFVQKVCANDEYKYKTGLLEPGDYSIRQISNGEGYMKDEHIYSVSITENNLHPLVILSNKIKSNKVNIIKKYCDKDRCSLEGGASFEVYNSNNSLVNVYNTDNIGKLGIELGYGRYQIIQVNGKDGYDLVDSFQVFINDEKEYIYYELIDNKKEEYQKREPIIDDDEEEEPVVDTDNKEEIIDEVIEEEIVEEVPLVIEEKNDEELTPPDTGVVYVFKGNKWVKVVFNAIWDIMKKYAKFAVLL